MSDLICVFLLSAGLIVVFTAIIGSKTDSKECLKCQYKHEGNCLRCSKHRYNRSIFKTFKEVWGTW